MLYVALFASIIILFIVINILFRIVCFLSIYFIFKSAFWNVLFKPKVYGKQLIYFHKIRIKSAYISSTLNFTYEITRDFYYFCSNYFFFKKGLKFLFWYIYFNYLYITYDITELGMIIIYHIYSNMKWNLLYLCQFSFSFYYNFFFLIFLLTIIGGTRHFTVLMSIKSFKFRKNLNGKRITQGTIYVLGWNSYNTSILNKKSRVVSMK